MTWIFFLNQHPGSCSFFQLLNCFAVCTLQLIRAETSIQYSSQIRAIVYNDHEKIILLFILFLGLFIYITQNKMNILGLTRQHKIAWKSGRKFILKFSPQADFNFVQPWFISWNIYRGFILWFWAQWRMTFPRLCSVLLLFNSIHGSSYKWLRPVCAIRQLAITWANVSQDGCM